MNGFRESTHDSRDYVYSTSETALDLNQAVEFHIPLKVPLTVRDQGSTNSCTACAVSTAIEYLAQQIDSTPHFLADSFIYGKRYSYKGLGLSFRDALTTVLDTGTPQVSWFTYHNIEMPAIMYIVQQASSHVLKSADQFRVDSYVSLQAEEIKSAVIKGNSAVVLAFEGFNPDIKCHLVGDHAHYRPEGKGFLHAVFLLGWVPDGWLIQNSWGKGWGKDGTAVIPYDVPMLEAWGIIDHYIPSDLFVYKPERSSKDWLLDLFKNVILWLKQSKLMCWFRLRS